MLTRRDFLRRLALSSLGVAAWGCGRSDEGPSSISDPAPSRVDVAVVGAGMSGLYAAYRLLRANRAGWTSLAPQGALRVAVFEAGTRIGGRLYSSEFCAAVPGRVVGGYQALPLRLARAVGGLGATISTRFPLRRVESDGSDFVLTFTGARQVRAGSVFLAMPPRSLELLEGTSLPLTSAQFRSDLQAVTRQASTRLFLAFREPWWTRAGPSLGFSRTDLPLRQCVYFGTEGRQAGADPANLNSLILATSNDGTATRFWADYLDHPPAGGTSTPFLSSGVGPELEAPRALVQEAARQLQQLHGVPVPEPYWGAYIDWSRDPYGAAWHFWAPGARSWEVIPRLEAPLAPQRLFVVGEAFSTNQGWVEGALNSVENVLQVQLGLAPPPGIRPTYLPADFRVAVGAGR